MNTTPLEAFFNTIETYKVLTSEAKAALSAILEVRQVPKGHVLVQEGKVCHELFYLNKGCARGCYTNSEGKDMTTWFAFEHSFVTSFYSFISRKPANENIVLLEDGELLALQHQQLQQLYDQFHEIERLGRLINERYYIQLEERMVATHFKTAKELYDSLLQDAPHMLRRVPLGHIASYLGITQETLSRIRGKA